MKLMFPRLARNFAKNGYYPTDEPTLERILPALEPASGPMSIIDPCCGEGVAIAELKHAMGLERTQAYGVEYDIERAHHARTLIDRCLQSNLMDTVVSARSFGLLFLNPPYGDLVRDQDGTKEGRGRARLEKEFYQRTYPLLGYDGVMVLIIPSSTLDDEFVGWITRHFADLRIFRAVERQFRQVVIFGRRVRQTDLQPGSNREIRALLLKIGRGEQEAEELPQHWNLPRYRIPQLSSPVQHFYRKSMEPQQFAQELQRLRGLWSSFDTHLGCSQKPTRAPARALGRWHLALALAGGAISGVVRSDKRILVVKGDTHKEKTLRTDITENEDGDLVETRILTDVFVPVIKAWDMTPGSPTHGQLLTIK